MRKSIFILVLVAFSLYCAQVEGFKLPAAYAERQESFQSPHRPLRPQSQQQSRLSNHVYESPQQAPIEFVNFRKCLIKALEDNNVNLFNDYLKRYFKSIPYDMQIKKQAYYASMFYWILRELSSAQPMVRRESSNETMRLFFKNRNQNYFAVELFIASDSIDVSTLNKDNSYVYTCVDRDTNKLHKFTTIRILIDFLPNLTPKKTAKKIPKETTERASLQVYSFEPKTKNRRIVDADYVCALDENSDTNPRLESPVHKIIRILDQDLERLEDKEVALHSIQQSLETFYNDIPKRFRAPFKIGGHEQYYHALFFSICQLLRANYAEPERKANNGRMDLLLRSSIRSSSGAGVLRYIIIEFKHRDRDAKKANKQIQARQYYNAVNLSNQVHPILLLGINIISSGERIQVSNVLSSSHNPAIIASPIRTLISSPGYRFKQTDDVSDDDIDDTTDETTDEDERLPGGLSFQEFIS